MSIDPNVSFPNVAITSIYVGGIELFPRSDTYYNEALSFDKIIIDEDMFAESIFGSIEFYDYDLEYTFSEKLQIGDLVVIEADGYRFQFEIMDVNIVTDLASKELVGPQKPVKVILRFASKLFAYSNFDVTLYDDFIGKISVNQGLDKDPENKETSFVEGIDLPANDIRLEGFVNTLVEAAAPDKELIADETFNSIWLKYDPSSYPWSKLSSSSRLSQVMNYICEYACYYENQNAVNFFFWEDLFNWNFRCIESLVQEDPVPASQFPGDEAFYYSYVDENRQNAIVSLEVINTTSPIKLFDGGGLDSEMVRIKPKWNDIYSDFIDTAYALEKTLIKYDYAKDVDNWLKIEPKYTLKDIPGVKSTTVRLSDTNYGYYSYPYNSKNTPWWSYHEDINSYQGDLTDEEFIRELDPEPTRLEERVWQSQFDFCELPGSYLRVIYKDIKWPIFQYKRQYATAKRAKTKWDVYKKSVCCVRDLPETFFAVLTGANKIHGSDGETLTEDPDDKVKSDSGGIWAYNWCEVEFWPRDAAKEVLSGEEHRIIEFEDNTFPFVFVRPKGYLEGMAPADFQNFSDTRAFNLNETLNSKAPKALDIGFKGEGVTAAPPFTLLMNPGISDALGYTLGDKNSITSYPKNFAMMPVGKFRISGKGCPPQWSDEGNNLTSDFYFGGRIVQMYRISKDMLTGIHPKLEYVPPTVSENNQNQDAAQDGVVDTGNTEEDVTPPDTVNTKLINENKKIGVFKDLYVFDVENAHDGLCGNC